MIALFIFIMIEDRFYDIASAKLHVIQNKFPNVIPQEKEVDVVERLAIYYNDCFIADCLDCCFCCALLGGQANTVDTGESPLVSNMRFVNIYLFLSRRYR
jgi:hypothetical protein